MRSGDDGAFLFQSNYLIDFKTWIEY